MCLRKGDREELTFHETMQAVESFTVNTRFQVPSSVLLKAELVKIQVLCGVKL